MTVKADLASAASLLGRKGGRVTSAAKAKAARENGKKGGAPRKACRVCGYAPSSHPVADFRRRGHGTDPDICREFQP